MLLLRGLFQIQISMMVCSLFVLSTRLCWFCPLLSDLNRLFFLGYNNSLHQVLWNPFEDIVPRASVRSLVPTVPDVQNKEPKKKAVK